MADTRILIVDDDSITKDILKEIIKNDGFIPVLASNGREAMDLIKKEPFLIIITDIEMPVMDGNELITLIREIDRDAIIIVLTSHSELELVIDIMKKGVYDYIIKPIEQGEILMKIGRAYETACLRKTVKVRENEKVARLENQLNWLKWNEQILRRDFDRIDSTLFKSLHTSFNQGAGFGSILTLINIVSSTAVKEGKNYLIDAEVFDMIKYSSDLAFKTIDVFASINNIISNKFQFKTMSLEDLHELLNYTIIKLSKYKKMKNHTILISDKKSFFSEKNVQIEPVYFEVAFTELLVNAFKFSKKNTIITVIMEMVDKNLELSVISDPEPGPGKIIGIPEEYQNLIFEPFFRMANNVYEDYQALDFGLGLVTVNKIVLKHNGTIKVYNAKDHSNIESDPVIKVDFTVSLPFISS